MGSVGTIIILLNLDEELFLLLCVVVRRLYVRDFQTLIENEALGDLVFVDVLVADLEQEHVLEKFHEVVECLLVAQDVLLIELYTVVWPVILDEDSLDFLTDHILKNLKLFLVDVSLFGLHLLFHLH